MSKYVKNADLTIEYIVRRAFQVGAIKVYSDIRPGYHKQIITVWPNGEIVGYPMEDYFYSDNQPAINFSYNLPSFRRSVENQGYYLRLEHGA